MNDQIVNYNSINPIESDISLIILMFYYKLNNKYNSYSHFLIHI